MATLNWKEQILDPARKEWAEKVKVLFQVDLFSFASVGLNYDKLVKRVHLPICNFLTDSFVDQYVLPKLLANGMKRDQLPVIGHPSSLRQRKKLILTCRDSFKSTVISRSFPLWCLKENPHLNILLDSEVKENSQKYLREIKAHCEGNLFFRALYGDWVNPKKWAETEIIIAPARTQSTPSIMTTGVNSTTTSQHFDIIIIDDPCSWENTSTPELIDKTIQHWQELKAQLKPGGFMIVVGTPYTMTDLFAHIQANFKHEYDIFVQFAKMKDGSLWFPERISAEYLKEREGITIRQREMHNAHYYGEVRPLSEIRLSIERIKLYNELDLDDLYLFEIVDPANSKKSWAANSAIIILGMDCNKNIYLVEYEVGKWKPDETIVRSGQMASKYSKWLKIVAPEVESGYEYFGTALRRELVERKVNCGFEELKTHGHSKQARVLQVDGLEMVIAEGRFFTKPQAEMKEFYDEAIYFPKSVSMDILDGCAYGVKLCYPPPKIEKTTVNREWQSIREHFDEQLGLNQAPYVDKQLGVL